MYKTILFYIVIVMCMSTANCERKREVHVSEPKVENTTNLQKPNTSVADFPNEFHLSANGQIVTDSASGLTWQQSGSERVLAHGVAKAYVHGLNRRKFAGHNDWRLPTLEEVKSLIENKKNSDSLRIDPVFDKRQAAIWTSHEFPDPYWRHGPDINVVDFYSGSGRSEYDYHRETATGFHHVRAVRSYKNDNNATSLLPESSASHKSSHFLRLDRRIRIRKEEIEYSILSWDFYDSYLNRDALDFDNQFTVVSNEAVVDRASDLVWQKSGSYRYLDIRQASSYIDSLNNVYFANYSDWRMPTMEEAMSLMENKKNKDVLYIDPRFDKSQKVIWTSDTIMQHPCGGYPCDIRVEVERNVQVDFSKGRCLYYYSSDFAWVRAVSSEEDQGISLQW